MDHVARFPALTAPLAPWRAVARWHMRQGRRALQHRLLHTLLGRYALGMGILASVLAAPAVAALLRRGAWDGPPPSPAEAQGALVIGHAALLLGFVALFAATLARTFVLRREEGPLQAHPSALPALALFRLAAAWATAAVAVLPLFYLFHWHFLARLGAPPAATLLLHLATTLAWLLAAALPVAAWARRGLHGARPEGRARALHLLGAATAWLALSAPVVLVPGMRTDLPAMAAAASRALHLGLVPLAASNALAAGEGWTLATWCAALAAAALVAVRSAARWAVRAPWELPLDLAAEGTIRYVSAFDQPGRRGGRVALFWTKDVRLSAARQPLAHLALHWGLLTAGVAGVVLARAALPPELHPVAVALLVVALPAVLALLRTPGSLGVEGENVWLLRTVLRPVELFACKLLPALGRVALPAAVHGTVVGLAARLLEVAGPTPAGTAALAAGAGALFALAGTAAGFLFPDFSRALVLVPGATRVGLLAYLVPTVLALGWTASAFAAHSLFGISAAGVALLLVGFALTAAAGWGGVAAWALHRMTRWER